MIPLFLQKFPKFKEQWEINRQRIAGFERYTNETQGKVSNVNTSSLPAIRKVNELGFFTTDSQDGNIEEERAYCEGFLPRELLDSFVKGIKTCNKEIEYIVYPSNVDYSQIELTTPYTRVAYYKPDEIRTYVLDLILNSAALDTHNTIGYYRGERLKPINLDVKNEWVLFLAYDFSFGRPTLGKDGLLTCIERALTTALQSKQGGRRRKTRRRTHRRRTYRRR
jgi:hypothetical protein